MRYYLWLAALVIIALSQLAYADEAKTAPTKEQKNDAAQSEEILLNAYKREFAFLEAERNALQTQLSELDTRMAGKVSAARSTVVRLQQVVAERDLEISGLQKDLDEIENAQSNQESPDTLFSNLRSRASGALVQLGRDKIAAEQFANKDASNNIKALLDITGSALADGQGLHRVEGRFFDHDGVLVNGTLLRVGYVASYGASATHAGMLRPAGDGRLQLVKDADGVQAAKALASGVVLPTLPIFLYENLEKAVELPEPKTVESILKAGGVIAYIIAALGVLAILLLIIRGATLTYYAILARRVRGWVQRQRSADTDSTAAELESARGPHARVLTDVIKALPLPRQAQMDAFNQSFLTELPRLDRFGALILVLAAIAPLMGLLGTVTGMIATFDTITQFGTGNPKLLSGGISEALITTELGLIVAIPAVLFGNLLKGWAEDMKDSIEGFCLDAMNRQYAESPQLVVDGASSTKTSPARGEQIAS